MAIKLYNDSGTQYDATDTSYDGGSIINKILTETIGLVELFGKSLSRTLLDLVAGTENINKKLERTLIDSLSLNEIMTKIAQFFRTVTDSILGSEKINKFLNGVEQIWNNITKTSSSIYTQDTKLSTSWTDDDKPNHLYYK